MRDHGRLSQQIWISRVAVPRKVSEVPSQSHNFTSGYSLPTRSTRAGSSFSPQTYMSSRSDRTPGSVLTMVLSRDGEKYIVRRPWRCRSCCSFGASSSVDSVIMVTCLPFITSDNTAQFEYHVIDPCQVPSHLRGSVLVCWCTAMVQTAAWRAVAEHKPSDRMQLSAVGVICVSPRVKIPRLLGFSAKSGELIPNKRRVHHPFGLARGP
eukprot:SAG31_NODE_132_length_23398_cov_14.557620_9_plen_209_part_00